MGGQTFKNLSLYCEYHRHVQCADVTFDDICNIMSSDTISNIMQYKVLSDTYTNTMEYYDFGQMGPLVSLKIRR